MNTITGIMTHSFDRMSLRLDDVCLWHDFSCSYLCDTNVSMAPGIGVMSK